ncbi:MAG: putative toxin-antitoxin system toxin component, PIN family [Terriglobia bacterium]
MISRERIVVDNNVLIGRLLLPHSVPALAPHKVVETGQLLISGPVLAELAAVLSREKFDRYISIEDRQQFFRLLGRIAEMVPIIYTIRACRDPKDDLFLELAVNGAASIIVTGGKDLLALNPFHGIPIITPASYLRL